MKELYEKTCAALMTHSYPNTGCSLVLLYLLLSHSYVKETHMFLPQLPTSCQSGSIQLTKRDRKQSQEKEEKKNNRNLLWVFYFL